MTTTVAIRLLRTRLQVEQQMYAARIVVIQRQLRAMRATAPFSVVERAA